VIKRPRRQESSKYVNVAVLEGDQIKIVKQSAEGLGKSPALLGSLLRTDTPERDGEPVNALVELAVSMRAHKRGGSLLVVRAGTDAWRESIIWPAPYLVRPPFPELAELMRDGPRDGRQRRWEEQLKRAVDAVAGLTAVDGATILDDRFELLAFGAKIGRRQDGPRVERVVVTEQIEGSVGEVVNAAQLGGTRHLSAAQFTQDQTDALALVASQDGRFTVFAWSEREEMVHAHRVESLLL
jgi:hypothetical protein